MIGIIDINKDVIPIVAPNSPTKYKKLIPKRLVKRLGEFDAERWTSVLSKHRVTMMINECECDSPVVAEYDEQDEYIFLQIIDTKCENLAFKVVQAILHEMVHVDQAHRPKSLPVRKTSFKNDFINYLSSYEEIEAYAHCLYLETMNGVNVEDCPVWKLYEGTDLKTQSLLLKNFRKWSRIYQNNFRIYNTFN